MSKLLNCLTMPLVLILLIGLTAPALCKDPGPTETGTVQNLDSASRKFTLLCDSGDWRSYYAEGVSGQALLKNGAKVTCSYSGKKMSGDVWEVTKITTAK